MNIASHIHHQSSAGFQISRVMKACLLNLLTSSFKPGMCVRSDNCLGVLV
ncbi:hypothetical protein KP509_06G071800 [Ceratopteris richardii]|uniref:Uncharacterized protein n=1 Tax=Ceratopteris richardii TaxID=49495 RepID=A0A8T2UPA7_CERRI|nr:hypothetical protein KP509_06G071800 [Ceratopteris richardii]